jgi:hypothetical protein
MHNFDVAILDYSYMFRLLQNNHHQAEYRKYKKEIMLHTDRGVDLRLTEVLAHVSIYVPRRRAISNAKIILYKFKIIRSDN